MTEKLYEITFKSGTVKRAWAADVIDALNKLGFNNAGATLLAVVAGYTIRAEVTL